MPLWIYPNKYMKDVDNRACSSFPVRGQSLSGIAIVIVKWARFSAFGYLQKALIRADFGWLQSNGHYAEGDTGRANTQLHSRSPWLHTALHAPALPVGAPNLLRYFLPSAESTSRDKRRKSDYKVGRRVCAARPALRRLGVWVTRFIRRDIKRTKTKGGKVEGRKSDR